MVHISLVPTLVLMVLYVSTYQRMCAVPSMAVFLFIYFIITIIYSFINVLARRPYGQLQKQHRSIKKYTNNKNKLKHLEKC